MYFIKKENSREKMDKFFGMCRIRKNSHTFKYTHPFQDERIHQAPFGVALRYPLSVFGPPSGAQTDSLVCRCHSDVCTIQT